MDLPVNVPIDDPHADTEWNDILRKHGVIPEKPPSPTPVIEEALLEARRLAHENRLEGKDLDELAELEDEEDDDFLQGYRHRRLAELSNLSKNSVHGQVYPLQKPDYSREVTDASRKGFVLVLLSSSLGNNIESRLMTELWPELASRFGDLKFCEIRGDMCIEGYPERNCPTVLIYRDGDIVKQIVTLKELRGELTAIQDMETMLVSVGAVPSTDHRIHASTTHPDGQSKKLESGNDSDDEWD